MSAPKSSTPQGGPVLGDFTPSTTAYRAGDLTRGRKTANDADKSMYFEGPMDFTPSVAVYGAAKLTRGRKNFNDADKSNYFE